MDEQPKSLAEKLEAHRLELARMGGYDPAVTDPRNREEKPGELDIERVSLLSWEAHTLRPLRDVVVIELEPPEERASGVIIPESAHRREPLVAARVVAVGPKVRDFSAGDRVLVRGNPGYTYGPYRVLTGQGAVEGVIE